MNRAAALNAVLHARLRPGEATAVATARQTAKCMRLFVQIAAIKRWFLLSPAVTNPCIAEIAIPRSPEETAGKN